MKNQKQQQKNFNYQNRENVKIFFKYKLGQMGVNPLLNPQSQYAMQNQMGVNQSENPNFYGQMQKKYIKIFYLVTI